MAKTHLARKTRQVGHPEEQEQRRDDASTRKI
jgi:hypothetical protein